MPGLTDKLRAERRDHVLLAARRCFQAQGFHAAGMGDIVRASGLLTGAAVMVSSAFALAKTAALATLA